jgi:hypothetical protein
MSYDLALMHLTWLIIIVSVGFLTFYFFSARMPIHPLITFIQDAHAASQTMGKRHEKQ